MKADTYRYQASMVLYALPIVFILLLLFCAMMVNYHFGTNLATLFVLILLVLVSALQHRQARAPKAAAAHRHAMKVLLMFGRAMHSVARPPCHVLTQALSFFCLVSKGLPPGKCVGSGASTPR